MSRPRILVIAVTVTAALLFGASPASAHPMPHSVVLLDVHESSVTASLELPVQDFDTASGLDLSTVAEAAMPAAAVRAYLQAHVRAETLDGQAWTVTIGTLGLGSTSQTSTGPYRELTASAVLTPPAGADVRHFVLKYDAIVHQVVTHTILVSVRQDWASGSLDGATQVGTIAIDVRSMTVPSLTVDLGKGSTWSGFLAMLKLGGNHILTGTDHLLFLLILLLPATLTASGGRWRSPAGFRKSLTGIARVTLAFTAGHSTALALSSFGRLDIPSWPVEAFIAVSILIGAVHAIRPLFPGREALVAGVFGLGHGMAFSFVLAEMQLSTGRLALSLLGFNLGIELVQLLLVALALPALLVVARSRGQRFIRIAGAGLTGVAALGWLLDRLGAPNPVARIADAAGSHTTAMLIGLAASAVLAGLAMAAQSRRDKPAQTARKPITRPRPTATRPSIRPSSAESDTASPDLAARPG